MLKLTPTFLRLASSTMWVKNIRIILPFYRFGAGLDHEKDISVQKHIEIADADSQRVFHRKQGVGLGRVVNCRTLELWTGLACCIQELLAQATAEVRLVEQP